MTDFTNKFNSLLCSTPSSEAEFDEALLGSVVDRYGGLSSALLACGFDDLGWKFRRFSSVARDVVEGDTICVEDAPRGGKGFGFWFFTRNDGDGVGVVGAARLVEVLNFGEPFEGGLHLRFDRPVSLSRGDVCYSVYGDSFTSTFLLDVAFPLDSSVWTRRLVDVC